MKHLTTIIFALLTAFSLISASEDPQRGKKRQRGDRDESSDSETLSETAETDASGSSSFPTASTATSISISSPRLNRPAVRRRVTFSPEAIAATNYEITGKAAELKYFNALFTNKLNLADAMRRQGLILSPSVTTFQGINKLLRGPEGVKPYLDQVIKYHPHVFSQFYAAGVNVFRDANPIHVKHVLNSLKSDHNILMNIYKEHLRNPQVIEFPDEFYIESRSNRALEMIELAEASGNAEEIRKCYLLPSSLLYHDIDGDTVFTKAVKTKNVGRINWLFQRSDAVAFMFTRNYDEFNVFDLAMELFDEELDPDYSVFRCLLQVISASYRYNTVQKFEMIVDNITNHCREADSREILLEALEEEFEAAKAYATENAVADIQDDFIENVQQRLAQLLDGTF